MPTIDPPLLVSHDETVAVSVRASILTVYRIAADVVETIELPTWGRLVAAGVGTFGIVGTEAPTRVTVRAFDRPDAALVMAEVGDGSLVVVDGDASHLDALPPLVVVGPTSALVRIEGSFRARNLEDELPEWATDPESALLGGAGPDDHTALICGYRFGNQLLAWDPATARLTARVDVPGQGVNSACLRPGGGELWIGQTDTLERIDTTSWNVTESRRLRNAPTGSFIEALAFSADGRRLAISHGLREARALPFTEWPWYAPKGSELLILDADEFRITHGVPVERWLDEIAWLSDGRVVAREWGSEGGFRVLQPEPMDHPLYPARAAGDWDWR